MKIKRALISVSNKNNLKPLLQILKKEKIEIISSGGTFKEIKRLKNLESDDLFKNDDSLNKNASIPFPSNSKPKGEAFIFGDITEKPYSSEELFKDTLKIEDSAQEKTE